MATKDKKIATKKTTAATKITRITASDNSIKPAKKETATKKPIEVKKQTRFINPLASIGRYFAGAWYELKQVRWPTRKATWSMTAAMLGFTAFFVILILLLDALFKYLFQVILG